MSGVLLCSQPSDRLKDIVSRLEKTGYACQTAASVNEACQIFDPEQIHLVMIDTSMPWTDSRLFLAMLRDLNIPLIFLAENKKNDRHLKAVYRGFCEVISLSAAPNRILKNIMQFEEQAGHLLIRGPLVLDPVNHTVMLDSRKLSLTEQEYSLLQALMQKPDLPVSREELLRIAWGYQSIGMTRTVDVHIQRLRRKIGSSLIETVYRTGYQLNLSRI